MSNDLSREIAALLGSRICHDLISPIGAISNGVELLAMSGGASAGAEISLISESVDNANARVRFFRITFGMASAGQSTGPTEMVSIFKDLGTSRLTFSWGPEGEISREETKLAGLLVMCIETALPRGGAISVKYEHEKWVICARADRLEPAADLWARLGAVASADGLKPSQIQFLLAPLQAELLGRRITHRADEGVLHLMA